MVKKKPRKNCWSLELDVYPDKSGFEIGSEYRLFISPTQMGSGAPKLRQIAKWLNEVADWTEGQRPPGG